MRKKIVAANWKMNLTKKESLHLFGEVEKSVENINFAEVFCFAPFVFLDALHLAQNDDRKFAIGAQNFYPKQAGAFTGEISTSHLSDIDITNVLIGHSERRVIFGESDALIKEKVNAAIEQGFKLFFCCGEPLAVRESGEEKKFVENQLSASLLHLGAEVMSNVVIAYEPIWAIGTGETASALQANEMHEHIRSVLSKKYGDQVAHATRIIYGGSCNPTNAHELFSMPHIDGGLIGGASLKAEDFLQIIEAAK
jgi:triosephosphate isomerase